MILSIHTALSKMSLALVQNGQVLDQVFYDGPTAVAEDLLLWIPEILKRNHKTQKEIQAIGVCYGPGAFTGLRLAVITAKTLALAFNIPLYGFNLFEGIAKQLQLQNISGKIQVSYHACRDQANNAQIEIQSNQIRNLEIEMAVDENSFWNNLPKADVYLGDYPKQVQTLDLIPEAAAIGLLVEEALKAKKPTQSELLQILYSHEPNVRLSAKPELARLRENS